MGNNKKNPRINPNYGYGAIHENVQHPWPNAGRKSKINRYIILFWNDFFYIYPLVGPKKISGTPELGEKQWVEEEREKLVWQWPATLATSTTGGAHKQPGPKERKSESQC